SFSICAASRLRIANNSCEGLKASSQTLEEAWPERYHYQVGDLGGCQGDPDALTDFGAAYIAQKIGSGGIGGQSSLGFCGRGCWFGDNSPRRFDRLQLIGIENFGAVDDLRP